MNTNKHNTIGKGEEERAVNGGNDKFYTKPFIANFYSEVVKQRFGAAEYIEPTAGNGAFMQILPNIVGYDLLPERDGIIECDVFENTFKPTQVIIGNPPFGMNASIALAVFNHIASFHVKAICFIVPRTFKKESLQNKLHKNYHITFEQDVIDNAFTVEGKNKNVPCVFQIWEFKKSARMPHIFHASKYINFVSKDEADIAVRRAGGKAGQLLDDLDHPPSSTYFLQITHPLVPKAIQLMDLSVVNNTSGVRSLSKSELCKELNKIMRILC